MKKLTIKLNLDERKYDALHTFSTQKGIDIDAEFVYPVVLLVRKEKIKVYH